MQNKKIGKRIKRKLKLRLLRAIHKERSMSSKIVADLLDVVPEDFWALKTIKF